LVDTAYIFLEKQGPKICAIRKFRDIMKTFSVAVGLFRNETNPTLQTYGDIKISRDVLYGVVSYGG
jgi:hypothetical protein